MREDQNNSQWTRTKRVFDHLDVTTRDIIPISFDLLNNISRLGAKWYDVAHFEANVKKLRYLLPSPHHY